MQEIADAWEDDLDDKADFEKQVLAVGICTQGDEYEYRRPNPPKRTPRHVSPNLKIITQSDCDNLELGDVSKRTFSAR
jgi:hypothetical protein